MKHIKISVLAAGLMAVSVANAASTYTAKINGALVTQSTIVDINIAAVPINPPVFSLPELLNQPGASVLAQGQMASLELEVASDGRPVAWTSTREEESTVAGGATAYIRYMPGYKTIMNGASNPLAQEALSNCALTVGGGTATYNCLANMVANTGNAYIAKSTFDFATPQGGIQCLSPDPSDSNAFTNGCASATVWNGACATAGAAPAGYPAGILSCADAESNFQGQLGLGVSSNGEGFSLTYTYTGGEPGDTGFEITGVTLTSRDITFVPAITSNFITQIEYNFGAAYSGPSGNTIDVSVVTGQSFIGSAKNVPAMGTFGLIALFSGLVAVAFKNKKVFNG